MSCGARFAWRLAASALVVALPLIACVVAARLLLPQPHELAYGVRIAGLRVPPGTDVYAFVEDQAHGRAQQQVRLRIDDQQQLVTLQQLGVRFDSQATAAFALSIGRRGGLAQRIHESLQARAGLVDVPLRWSLQPAALTDRLLPLKETQDRPAQPARYDFRNRKVLPHTDGSYLDVYASVDALDRVVRNGDQELAVVRTSIPPLASAELLTALDISQTVGRYSTRYGYLGSQADRAHNIATAAARLDGVVMLPGQVLSFNDLVGHRTIENGFRKGWEIFKGEMVEGVGGGTCQVASTLYASVFLAGLHVVDRSPHSRPSAYIPVGLDATVVDGLVDLKIRNNFDFPLVVHATTDKGQITVELLGEQRPARVTFERVVVGTRAYKRKVTEASWLPEGKIIRKQRGIRGYTVKRTRRIELADGTVREEVSLDHYPPTTEIFIVPPGTDLERDLPPLPDDGSETKPESDDESGYDDREPRASNEGAAGCEPDCPPRARIVDGPAAGSPVRDVATSVVIRR